MQGCCLCACYMYVCMFHTEVCELINVLPPGPAYLYNNNNASISSRWFDSQMTHLPTLNNSVFTNHHACSLYLMEGYVHQHKTAWKNAHCNIQYNQKTEMANPHDPSVMICSEASLCCSMYNIISKQVAGLKQRTQQKCWHPSTLFLGTQNIWYI